MRIILNSYIKIIKTGWVILLLSSMLFSCQKELSEKEKVGQFIADLLNSVLDDIIYSKKREEIEMVNGIHGRKINLLLVVKDFSIKDISQGKCEEFIEEGRPFQRQIDCYIVTVFFTKSRYINLDGKLKEDGYFLDKDSTLNFQVKKVDNKFRLLYDLHLGNMLSEKGEQKLLDYIKKRK
jgi:hypothetical protein